MFGIEVPIIWQGRRARAWVPSQLNVRSFDLDRRAETAAIRAAVDLEVGAAAMPADVEASARLLLRAEGVASSFIEGVTAPLVDIVLAESGTGDASGPASWIAANLAAVVAAIDSSHDTELTVAALCQWHRTLMTGSPLPTRHVGVIRSDQGWIGGTSPMDAHLVTPPPEYLGDLLADLVAYANRDDVDPVAQAAIVHAQFEIIHPFADGNGRIGRILVAWMLVRHLHLVTPPPVSARIAADVGGYSAGLTLYRLGNHDRWVEWFASAVAGAGRAQTDLVRAVDDLRTQWAQRLRSSVGSRRRVRDDAAAWRVLELVPRHVVLSAATVAQQLGVATNNALAALRVLADHGIVVEYGTFPVEGPGRPAALFVSTELLGLVGSTPLRG